MSQNASNPNSQIRGCIIILILAGAVLAFLVFTALLFFESPLLGFNTEATESVNQTGFLVTPTSSIESLFSAPFVTSESYPSTDLDYNRTLTPPNVITPAITNTSTATIPLIFSPTYTPTISSTATATSTLFAKETPIITPSLTVTASMILETIGPFDLIENSLEFDESKQYLFQGLEDIPAVFTLRLDKDFPVIVSINDERENMLLEKRYDTETNTIFFPAPLTGKYFFRIKAEQSSGSYILSMEYTD